jgi:hypothetical protein
MIIYNELMNALSLGVAAALTVFAFVLIKGK